MLKALTMTTMNYQGKGSKKTNNIKGAISTKHCCECKCLKPSCLLVLLIVVSTYSPSLMYDISCHSVEGFHPHESLTLQYASLMTGKKKKPSEVDNIVAVHTVMLPIWLRQDAIRENLKELMFPSWRKESTPKNYFANVKKKIK